MRLDALPASHSIFCLNKYAHGGVLHEKVDCSKPGGIEI